MRNENEKTNPKHMKTVREHFTNQKETNNAPVSSTEHKTPINAHSPLKVLGLFTAQPHQLFTTIN